MNFLGARPLRKLALAAATVTGAGVYGLGYLANPAWEEQFPAGDTPEKSAREKVVVLGSGWAATALVRDLDPKKFEITLVSPKNYFLMTPLLPGVTVGTVEARSVIAPVRDLLGTATNGWKPKFFEAQAISVDPKRKTVRCRDDSEVVSSSPEFTLKYDKLVVAVGAPCNTFGTPGVEQNAHFLKTVNDALAIRRRLADMFETASLPGTSQEEKKRLTSVVVVGGGPTGVEFAAELQDFLDEDLGRLYPELAGLPSITLIQSADHILNTYDKRISEYAEEHFARKQIDVRTGQRVQAVNKGAVDIVDKKTKKKASLPFGVCVWSTGLAKHRIVRDLQAVVGQSAKRRGLAVDGWLAVRGVPDRSIYALGDCADVKEGHEMLDYAHDLFKMADKDRSGNIDQEELAEVLQQVQERFPHAKFLLTDERIQTLFAEADANKSGTLCLPQFERALEHADILMRSQPATAQVAAQQGAYLAAALNSSTSATASSATATGLAPVDTPQFQYNHMGSFTTLGGEQAALELPGDNVSAGCGTMAMWYACYCAKQVTWRNRFLVVSDWTKKLLFGRDPSRL